MLSGDPLNITCYFLVDCVWKPWNQWTSCSEPCGNGLRTRTREIKIKELFGGIPCEHYKVDTEICKEKSCYGNF